MPPKKKAAVDGTGPSNIKTRGKKNNNTAALAIRARVARKIKPAAPSRLSKPRYTGTQANGWQPLPTPVAMDAPADIGYIPQQIPISALQQEGHNARTEYEKLLWKSPGSINGRGFTNLWSNLMAGKVIENDLRERYPGEPEADYINTAKWLCAHAALDFISEGGGG